CSLLKYLVTPRNPASSLSLSVNFRPAPLFPWGLWVVLAVAISRPPDLVVVSGWPGNRGGTSASPEAPCPFSERPCPCGAEGGSAWKGPCDVASGRIPSNSSLGDLSGDLSFVLAARLASLILISP